MSGFSYSRAFGQRRVISEQQRRRISFFLGPTKAIPKIALMTFVTGLVLTAVPNDAYALVDMGGGWVCREAYADGHYSGLGGCFYIGDMGGGNSGGIVGREIFDSGGGGAGNYQPPSTVTVANSTVTQAFEKDCNTAKPVNIPTGTKLLFELDFLIRGDGQPLEMFRRYTKSSTKTGMFGSKWAASIETGLTLEYNGQQCTTGLGSLSSCAYYGQTPTKIYFNDSDGSTVAFDTFQSGAWRASGVTAFLQPVSGGWKLVRENGDAIEFDGYGRPLTTKDVRGAGLTYTYASNTLTSITHTSGRSMSFLWSGNKVTAVTAPNGKSYGYGYDGNGYLASVVYPDNLGTRTYHYEDVSQLGGLTGISINGVRYTRYQYFPDGKVEWSGLEGGAERSTFAYGADYTNVTNALGQTTVYRLATINGSKRIWRIERPASSTCAAGARDTQYDANGNIDYQVDAYGVKTDYSYDADRRLIQKITGIGPGNETDQQQITQYVWDATYKGRLNQVKVFGTSTSQALNVTTYTYYPDGDARARLLQSEATTNQGGGTVGTLTTTYSYTNHPNNLVATMTVDGPLLGTGDAVTLTYDGAGNLLSSANSLVHTTTYANHTALGQPGRVTSLNGAVVNYTYNARGQVLTSSRTVNGITQTTTTTYDNRGRPISVAPRTGLTTSYSYDNFDRLIKVSRRRPHESYPSYAGGVHPPNPSCSNCGPGTPTNPPKIHGKIENVASDGVITGGVCLKAPATGATIAVYLGGPMGYSATPAGQLPATLPSTPATTSFCAAFGASASFNYAFALTPAMRQQFAGQQIYVYGISSLGNASLKFDGSGISSVVPSLPTPPSEFKIYTYNLLSQIIKIETGLEGTATEAHQTQYIDYDTGGFVSKRRGGNGQSLTYHYNANGDVDEIKDALNNTTTYAYDRHRRVSSVTDAGSGVTLMSYNALGLTTLVRDARYNSTAYAYDGIGNLLSQASPDTGMSTYTYNAQGQRTQLQRADLSTTAYTYDTLGRLKTTISGAQTRTLTYDTCTNGKGMLCVAAKTGGAATTTNLTFTPWGQLATRQDISGGNTDNTAYAYDDLNQLTGISYPSGISVGYGYNGQHLRVVNVTVSGISYRVAAPSHERAFGPATYLEFGRGQGFEGGSRWTQRNFDASDRIAGISTNTQNSGLLQSLTYASDTADRITDITNGVDSARSREFAYDALSRVVSNETPGAAVEGFGYDAIGNRTSGSINGVPNATLTYSATNSRLQSYVNGALTRNFTHNANGDITAFTGPDGVANTLTYDPFGRLASHIRSGVTTSYTVNALDQRMAKSNASSNSRYVYAGFNQLLAEYTNSQWSSYIWLGNEPVALIRNNNIYYIHNDHLGRPESVSGFDVNNNPAVVWKANNAPFDRTVTQDSIGGLHLGFPGQYFDTESGIWHNGYRDYLANAGGRYLQSDPIGLAGGMNTYVYAGGNPVTRIDPFGLEDFTCIASDPNKGNYINGVKQCGYTCTSSSSCSVSFEGPGYSAGWDSQLCRGAVVTTGVSPSGQQYQRAEGYNTFDVSTSGLSGLIDSITKGGFMDALEKALENADCPVEKEEGWFSQKGGVNSGNSSPVINSGWQGGGC